MAKTIKELRETLTRVAERMQSDFNDVAAEMAGNAKALSYRNIAASGVKGAAYSNTEYTPFFLLGKELNATGRSFLKQKKKDKELTNYKQLRGAQGLPTYVDLQYTGKMWAGVGVVRVENSGGRTVAILGGTTPYAQKIMNYNKERYGDFIMDNLTGANKVFIKQLIAKRVNEIFTSNGILNK